MILATFVVGCSCVFMDDYPQLYLQAARFGKLNARPQSRAELDEEPSPYHPPSLLLRASPTHRRGVRAVAPQAQRATFRIFGLFQRKRDKRSKVLNTALITSSSA
jgi:hypothetical protein